VLIIKTVKMANVASANLFAMLEDDVTEVNTVKVIVEPPKKVEKAPAPSNKKEAPKPAAPAKDGKPGVMDTQGWIDDDIESGNHILVL
jgi:hypothetical protein